MNIFMKIVCKFARFSNILEAWPSVHVPVCATAIVAVGGAGKGNGVLRMKWQVWAWESCVLHSVLPVGQETGSADFQQHVSGALLLLLLADVITMAQSQALLLRDCYLHVAVFLAGTIISILWLWLVIMTIVTLWPVFVTADVCEPPAGPQCGECCRGGRHQGAQVTRHQPATTCCLNILTLFISRSL